MTLPAAATKVHLDAATDDPKQARAELANLVDKFNDTLTHLNLSAVTSTPYAVGNGLGVSGSNIVVTPNTTNGSLVDVTSSGVRVGNGSNAGFLRTLWGYNNSTANNASSEMEVGINTTNAYARLFVNGGSGTPLAGLFSGSACTTFQYRNNAHIWQNQAATTEYMRLNSTGLGIGTSSHSNKLEVSGSMYQSGAYARIGDFNAGVTGNSPAGNQGTAFSSNITNSRAEVDIWNTWDPASYANTGILFTQRLTSTTRRDLVFMHNNGNVGIGTNSPGQLLTVAGTIESTSGGVKFPDGTTQTTANSKVVQVVNTMNSAVATTTTVMPYDDTIPQNTEGAELMTATITPTNASNKLRIDVKVFCASSFGDIGVALFQDATAGALAAGGVDIVNRANAMMEVSFTHYMTAGTTSATTFKVRGGQATALNTFTFNGDSGARLFGGVIASSITITEIT